MTVPDQVRYSVSTGNGIATEFPYDFLIPETVDDPQFRVYLINATTGAVTNLTLDADYSISGLGDPNGGTVTYPISGTPLASTHKIVLESNMPYEQQTDIFNSGTLYLQAIEDQFDTMTRLMQQLRDRNLRTFTADYNFTGDLTVTPAPGKLIGWNDDGTALEPKDGPSDIQAALEAVLAAGISGAAAQVSYAEEWAQKTDGPVSIAAGGDGVSEFSAKYWALEAQAATQEIIYAYPGSTVAEMLGQFAVINSAVTVRVPTDVATLAEAFTQTLKWFVPDSALVTILVESGRHSFAETARMRSLFGRNFEVIGASVINGTITGLASAPTPITGGYRCVYNVTGDISAVTTDMEAAVRAVKGAVATPIGGYVSVTSGSPIVTGTSTKFTSDFAGFGDGELADGVTWRIKILNRRYNILSVDSDTQLTLESNALDTVSEQPAIRYSSSASGAGTISTTAGSPTVTGSSINFQTTYNVGDQMYYGDSQCGIVKSIESSTSLTFENPAEFSYSGVTHVRNTNFLLHQGAAKIQAVNSGAGTITLDWITESPYPPPYYGSITGVIRIVRSVIEMSTNLSCISLAYGCGLGFIDQIALIGTGAGLSQQIAGIVVSRDQSDPNLSVGGFTFLRFGANLIIRKWVGCGIYGEFGAFIQGEFGQISECGSVAFLASRGCTFILRNTTASGCGIAGYGSYLGSTVQNEGSVAHGCAKGEYVHDGSYMHSQNVSLLCNTVAGFDADNGSSIAVPLGNIYCNEIGGKLSLGSTADVATSIICANVSHGLNIGLASSASGDDLAIACNGGSGAHLIDGGAFRSANANGSGNGASGVNAEYLAPKFYVPTFLGKYNGDYALRLIDGARGRITNAKVGGNGTASFNITADTTATDGSYLRTS